MAEKQPVDVGSIVLKSNPTMYREMTQNILALGDEMIAGRWLVKVLNVKT